MAYSNWGGEVVLNHTRLIEHCDCVPKTAFNLHSNSSNIDNIIDRLYHCVLGSNLDCLVLLYKNTISAVIVNHSLIYPSDTQSEFQAMKATTAKYLFVHDEYQFEILTIDGRKIKVMFKDRFGREWIGTSGLHEGRGFSF